MLIKKPKLLAENTLSYILILCVYLTCKDLKRKDYIKIIESVMRFIYTEIGCKDKVTKRSLYRYTIEIQDVLRDRNLIGESLIGTNLSEVVLKIATDLECEVEEQNYLALKGIQEDFCTIFLKVYSDIEAGDVYKEENYPNKLVEFFEQLSENKSRISYARSNINYMVLILLDLDENAKSKFHSMILKDLLVYAESMLDIDLDTLAQLNDLITDVKAKSKERFVKVIKRFKKLYVNDEGFRKLFLQRVSKMEV